MRRQRLLLLAVALVTGVLVILALVIALLRHTPRAGSAPGTTRARDAAAMGAPGTVREGDAAEAGSSWRGDGQRAVEEFSSPAVECSGPAAGRT